jgi:hypothetical protein
MAKETGGDDKLAIEQVRRHADLMSKYRSVFADDHQTIAQYALPNDSDINVTKTESVSGWTDQIFDTTMIQAAQTLANGQFNWWTPPNQPWAEYDVPEKLKDDDQEGSEDAVSYFGKASDKMMRQLGRSNFYPVKGMGDLGLSVFATDLIIFDESTSGNELFNFVHCKIGTYTIEEDYRGVVDTVRREMEMTYRQMKQVFNKPGDNIPKKITDQCKGAGADGKKFKVLHCIFPREDSKRIPNRKDGANKPIASIYISVEANECIRIAGYEESPILCRRFAKWGTDAVWGYGPSYLALPDARQVNYVQQYLDALAELHAYPRVLIPDNLEGDVDLRAGGTTTWDTSNAEGKPEEWATVGDYKLGLEMQEGRRKAIRDAFFTDAFKLLNSQPLIDKEMTAYEISQRQAEQLQGVAPAFARGLPEFILPLMRRGFGIMFRRGELGQPPDILMQEVSHGKKGLVMPEVVVTSRFNDALRALKNRGTEETFKFLAPMAEQKPELYDIFDLDQTVREYARNAGMAPDLIRKETGPNSVQAIRAARAAMQKQQMAAQQAETLGKAGKALGGSPQWMQDQVQERLAGGRRRAA